MFDELLQGKAGAYTSQVFPYVIGVTVAFVLIFVIVYVYRGFASRKSSALGGLSGEQFLSAEQMFKKGLITEAEYKRIRGKVAQRTLAQTEEHERQERERRILAQVAINPDLAKELLTPEQLAAAQARKAEMAAQTGAAAAAPTALTAGAAGASPAAPAAAVQPEIPVPSFEELTDPLALADWQASRQHQPSQSQSQSQIPSSVAAPASAPSSAPPTAGGIPRAAVEAMARRQALRQTPQPQTPGAPPAMNMPRVVQAKNEAHAAGQAVPAGGEAANAQKKRDIDILLEKGAITREEYERLSKFFE